MNREDIKRLTQAFEQFESAKFDLEMSAATKRLHDKNHEASRLRHADAEATLHALCIKFGVDPGAPAPLMAVPHPRSSPSDATVP